MRLSLVLALALVVTPLEAGAQTLYRWVTPDGRVEIGTSPPAGVRAEPWTPGASPAAAPTVVPAAQSGPRLRDPARDPGRDCRARLAEMRREIEQTETRIAGLEQRIESLSESMVAFQQNTCTRDDYGNTAKHCRSSSFSRDAEIDKAERELAEAQDTLADLETRARGMDCASEPK